MARATKPVDGPATPATLALDRTHTPYTRHRYEHDPAAPSYGLGASHALGVDASRVFKTLVVDTGGGPLAVVVVPVSSRLDLKATAAALGSKSIALATPSLAQRSTGYVVGGISPLGQKRPLPTVIDESAFGFQTVYVSGGRRGFDIELHPADLLRLTDGVRAPVARW